MTEAKRSTATYWLIFLLSTVAMFAFLWFKPAWFWICLPFVLTSLVKAVDRM